MKQLRLSKDLTLPLDAITQTFLVVGKRGSGKSNTAARFVEQIHRAGLPIVVLDPTDTWWGLKAGIDGGRGLDVYVFGGRKQDLPLDAGSGALIAEVLCEHRISMVLSVKHLSGRERSAFMVKFAQTLFQKWGGGPLHVVLEEAHELAPQMGGGRGLSDQDGEAAMLGAFKRLWKLGRSSGIGGTAVTQRPASLSKDITTQSEILIAHRTIGPQDVKAIGEWVKYHGEQLGILGELPTLPTGEAFVWAPEFPEGQPIGLKRTAILLRETYDSASTPKVGEARVEPKELAAVDLERLRAKMASTIEKAKADDPKALRAEIAGLRKELAAKPGAAAPVVERVTEIPREVQTQITALRKALEDAMKLIVRVKAQNFEPGDAVDEGALTKAVTAAVQQVVAGIESKLKAKAADVARLARDAANLEGDIASLLKEPLTLSVQVEKHKPYTVSQPGPPVQKRTAPVNGSPVVLPPGERATLIALAQYPDGLAREQLTVLTGYKRSSRDAYIQRLSTRGYVQVGPRILATDDGVGALGNDFEPLPTGEALQAYWLQRLPDGERKVLEVLIGAYPAPVEREVLDHETGYKRSSRDAYLQRLKAKQLVTMPGRAEVCASETLFEVR